MSDVQLPPPVDPTPATPGIPPGWYFDSSSRQNRWWDGQRWTEHFAASTFAAAPSTGSGSGSGVGVAALVLGIVGFLLTPIPLGFGLVFGAIPALLAVIFGIVATVRFNRQRRSVAMPVIGLVLGGLALLVVPLGAGTIW